MCMYVTPLPQFSELQLASFEIEPPENSGEKKRYQELRYTPLLHPPPSLPHSSLPLTGCYSVPLVSALADLAVCTLRLSLPPSLPSPQSRKNTKPHLRHTPLIIHSHIYYNKFLYQFPLLGKLIKFLRAYFIFNSSHVLIRLTTPTTQCLFILCHFVFISLFISIKVKLIVNEREVDY